MSHFATLLQSKQPVVFGVLNATPDSFSDGGRYNSSDAAIAHALELTAHGAEVIDIGGESTGPGAKPVSATEEQQRIIAIVKALADKICISVDTYHSETAAAALSAGAQIINDVSALRADVEMAGVIAKHSAYLVMMYCKDSPLPHVTPTQKSYQDVVAEIAEFFKERITHAVAWGIKKEKIILDPGMGGFLSSDASVSWELLARLNELKNIFPDYPLLIGTSRKGFLGGELKDRDPISQLTALAAIDRGANLIRTHNPAMLREFIAVQGKLNAKT